MKLGQPRLPDLKSQSKATVAFGGKSRKVNSTELTSPDRWRQRFFFSIAGPSLAADTLATTLNA